MNLLAIDTATEQFSAAVAADRGMWFFGADAGPYHSEILMDSIDILMQKAALRPEDLSGVVCMGGPGSFTGLRIGFSLAKGLALSLGIPFAAIPSLDCMAWPFSSWPGIVIPVIDAKRKAFFCALYRNGKQLGPVMDTGSAEIACAITAALSPLADNETPEQALLIGPGAQMLYEQLPGSALIRPGKGLRRGNAETLLEIARETRVFDKGTVDYFSGPEYIRKSDAELNSFVPVKS